MMSLVSVLGCGTWFFLIEEQLYYLFQIYQTPEITVERIAAEEQAKIAA